MMVHYVGNNLTFERIFIIVDNEWVGRTPEKRSLIYKEYVQYKTATLKHFFI